MVFYLISAGAHGLAMYVTWNQGRDALKEQGTFVPWVPPWSRVTRTDLGQEIHDLVSLLESLDGGGWLLTVKHFDDDGYTEIYPTIL